MAERTLDCTDIDQYLGNPMDVSYLREPIANNDIRRWVHAMHYPNLLHYDPAFAATSRWGKLVAPQSFIIVADDGHGAAPSCVGAIANSHHLFGGDEWWFYGPRVFGGDMIGEERIPFDYTVKETRFAGPTCFQRGDNHYYNQDGERIATQRSTSIRYHAEAGRESTKLDEAEEPVWSEEELSQVADRKLRWITMLRELGHGERYWDDVNIGDKLPERVIGPHSVISFTTEWRAYIGNNWGTMDLRKNDLEALGFMSDMGGYENDPDMLLINPELTDGAYYGPSRGHLASPWARRIGMPRAYGYGASMGAWVTDYHSGWAGEHGMVTHSTASYRAPVLVGDITIQESEVIDKYVDKDGRNLVQVRHTAKNQVGKVNILATAEIELAKKQG